MKISKKQFAIYMTVAFVLAWILQVVASVFYNNGNQMVFKICGSLVMYMPFLGVLVAKIPLKGMGWVPHLKGKIRYVFFALWVPALLAILGAALFFVVFPYTFDSEFLSIRNSLEAAGQLELLEAQGITIPMYLLSAAVQAITWAPFINMLLALGEEVGWRGVMHPYLKEKMGIIRGRIAAGVIWGAWHWPLTLLAGYEYGKEYIGAPFLGLIVFCICTVGMGILLDYVYEKTETIWLPSLMHGAMNAVIMTSYLIKPEYSHMAIFGPLYNGIISMIPMLILAAVICVKVKKPTAQDSVSKM